MYSCSTSYMAHMLMTHLGYGSRYDDYLALVGLKGDWAVKPAINEISDYVKDFYAERVEGTFDLLVKKICSRSTMFEFLQRRKTTLLNQITELYFALGGGGFQYFYNDRDRKLADLDQVRFSFDVIEKQRNNFKYNSWKTLNDFINDTCDRQKVRKIFNYFKSDWKDTMKCFPGHTDLIASLGDTDIYKFKGDKVSLMPMAGSIYNNEPKKKSPDKEVLFIMINSESGGRVHFSVRATSPSIHAGKICSNLASGLVGKFGTNDEITGGGHPLAAKCKTRSSGVSYGQDLEVFSALLKEMKNASEGQNREKAQDLGLDYVKN